MFRCRLLVVVFVLPRPSWSMIAGCIAVFPFFPVDDRKLYKTIIRIVISAPNNGERAALPQAVRVLFILSILHHVCGPTVWSRLTRLRDRYGNNEELAFNVYSIVTQDNKPKWPAHAHVR